MAAPCVRQVVADEGERAARPARPTRDGAAALAREILAREAARAVAEPREETVEVLGELRARSIPTVVLSNAWPSLRRLHRELGLDRFVKALVISAEEGLSKPDERVFRRALAVLGHPPGQVVFVDDWPGHVEAANRLGMRGIWLRHACASVRTRRSSIVTAGIIRL